MQSLSRKAEDYLEAILIASQEKGYARTKDIARELCIQPPTVVEMVKKLDRKGMITYRKYDGVTLTPEGRAIAEVIRDRHETLQSFLELIQVPHAVAVRDACMMEHELSAETIEHLRHFLAFIGTNSQASSLMRTFIGFSSLKEMHPGQRPGMPDDRLNGSDRATRRDGGIRYDERPVPTPIPGRRGWWRQTGTGDDGKFRAGTPERSHDRSPL